MILPQRDAWICSKAPPSSGASVSLSEEYGRKNMQPLTHEPGVLVIEEDLKLLPVGGSSCI